MSGLRQSPRVPRHHYWLQTARKSQICHVWTH